MALLQKLNHTQDPSANAGSSAKVKVFGQNSSNLSSNLVSDIVRKLVGAPSDEDDIPAKKAKMAFQTTVAQTSSDLKKLFHPSMERPKTSFSTTHSKVFSQKDGVRPRSVINHVDSNLAQLEGVQSSVIISGQSKESKAVHPMEDRSKKRLDESFDDVDVEEEYDSPLSKKYWDCNELMDTTLNSLTVRLIQAFRDSSEGTVDIKNALMRLQPKQKRRIYDILNVLQGVNLVEKLSMHIIWWKGGGPKSNSKHITDKVTALKKEIKKLDALEQKLDEKRFYLEQNLKFLCDDSDRERLNYLSQSDISACFPEDLILAVQGPIGTKLEMPFTQSGDINMVFEFRISSKTDAVQIKLLSPYTSSQISSTYSALSTELPEDRFTRAISGDSAIRLSPPPSSADYTFAMEENEGVCDMF